MKKCQFCGYEITRCGCLGTETKYGRGLTHKGCLENHLMKLERWNNGN